MAFKQSAMRWLRVIHRDLGFLMVGVSMIYGISGMILNHIGKHDPAFKTEEYSIVVERNLRTNAELSAMCEANDMPALKRALAIDEDHIQLMLEGGVGVYNLRNGEVDYETHRRNDFVYWINRLHYNRVGGWNVMGDFFAASLIFFALSGLFMVRGSKGIMGRGKWYLLVGLLIPILYIAFA